ncbi:hypothetical protein VB715_00050 [Crocosphaera sp. UHCC 0190]|uniref:hypothetical protein n=1 Tax=Crocosphaera sp. UHCC 0190 TaxID=3110246 RepID=UPI002B1F63DE|nr:hypothetical protein [Crocosphaera sp. UHCC 0190]MEA5508144.1 hypothetical protein [Crocosphaera sp. UHCC 0190]
MKTKKSQLTIVQSLQGAIGLTVALILLQSVSMSSPSVQQQSWFSNKQSQASLIHFR